MPPATGAVASPPAAAGTVLLGRYELGDLLGRGASAKVYLARDLLTGRSVAIKSFPNPRAAAAGDRPVAIEREAGILRRLRHRHVVRLHEILATRKKVHFVLDLAAGGELFSLVDASGRMTEDLARHYFRQLVSAVRYCHARGVYHRDIKPENLLLDESGALMVADFGLGAVAGTADGGGSLLRHTMCGTPAYVARVEAAGRKGGYRVRRDGKRATAVYVEEEESGVVVAKVSVFRIADAVSVVEVVKGDGPDAVVFWSELLEPAVKPPALSC